MKITIEYCTQWNYHPQAAGLAAELTDSLQGPEISLIPGTGGVFEVVVDGRLVFSKKQLKRFPAYQEVPTLLGV